MKTQTQAGRSLQIWTSQFNPNVSLQTVLSAIKTGARKLKSLYCRLQRRVGRDQI